jgi:hypothetical protein
MLKRLAPITATSSAVVCGALAFITFLFGSSVANASTYTPISFTSNGNIQSQLISMFPTGTYTPSNNSFGAPFSIGPSSGNNFDAVAAGGPLTITTSVPDVTNVYTLINAYSPNPGSTIGTIEFIGSLGATETFNLVAGTNVRDFYQGSFANLINGTTTQNAFMCNNPNTCLGGGGTGNVMTGETGNYVIDEQNFTLDAAFATQSLAEIILTNDGTGSTPIILGVTAADITSPTPIPAALPMLAGGLGLIGLLSRRRKRGR